MNQNPPPRRPNNTPPRGQRPANTGLGQPVRRTSTSGAPGTQRPAAPRPAPQQPRPLIHPARTARRRRQRTVILTIFVVIILLICMLIGLIFSELAVAIGTLNERTGKDKNKDKNRDNEITTTDPNAAVDPDGTSDVSDPVGMSMTTIQKAKEDVAVGNLLLINRDNAYVFPASVSNIVNLFDNRPYVTLEDGTKVRTFQLRNSNLSLDRTALELLNQMLEDFMVEYQCPDMLVTWAYRSYEDQQDLYEQYVADYPGYSNAQIKQLLLTQVDAPGYSEHHLGTSIDLKLLTANDITYTLADEPGYLSWLTENCWKYGFILRYPADKASITGVGYDPHHFRYVEVPHAYYMSQNGLCLEQYLEELRTTTSPNGEHLSFTVDGGASYEVYYVGASGNVVDIPVPADLPYTVSGDNMNGFIVTVTMN